MLAVCTREREVLALAEYLAEVTVAACTRALASHRRDVRLPSSENLQTKKFAGLEACDE